jgi:Flp pilus assembly secretin CpaC
MGVDDFGSLAQSLGMKRLLLAALLALVCICGFVQFQALRRLKAEGATLRAQLADLQARAEAEKASRAGQPSDRELERLQEERSELVRLRGQVAELRRDLKGMQRAMAKASNAASPAAMTNITAADLVQAFVANVQTTVPPQQTLVTGGWKLPSGNHALFFIEPVVGDADSGSPGQIMVQTRVVELSEEALSRHGLTGLKSDAAETGGQLLLTDAQQRQMLGALEREEGVNILAAPRLSTLSGRQAQIKVVNVHMTPAGESFETGPILDLVPTVAADGRSVDMRLSAQMRLRR